MSDKHDIWDKAKHMVFEEEDKPKAAVSVTHLVPEITESQKPYHSPFAPTTGLINSSVAVVAGSAIYNDLKSKTDFDATDVGKLIQSYLAPLAAVSMDDATRLKVAMQMAGHKDGLNQRAITDTLDNLASILEGEKVRFENSEKMFSQKIADDNKSLQQLQVQIADLQNRITAEQVKLKNTKDEFSSAYQTRMTEVNQQRDRYESLLKG